MNGFEELWGGGDLVIGDVGLEMWGAIRDVGLIGDVWLEMSYCVMVIGRRDRIARRRRRHYKGSGGRGEMA